MATAAKTRFFPRSAQPGRAAKKAKAKGLRSLDDIFAARQAAVRRGQYDILGRVKCLTTLNGEIDFRKDGPWLAQLTDEGGKGCEDPDGAALLLIGKNWVGFPDARTLIVNELCPDCQAPCLACDKGERLCMQPGCGGAGRIVLSYKTCTAPGCKWESGAAKRDCPTCEGAGQVPDQVTECGMCKGAGKHKCPWCFGTGMAPTGRKGGAPRDSDAPVCASCDGNARKIEVDAQPWRQYAYGALEGYTAFGPLRSILIVADAVRDPEQHYELVEISPNAAGNITALLVKGPKKTGQPMYLLGGEIALKRI